MSLSTVWTVLCLKSQSLNPTSRSQSLFVSGIVDRSQFFHCSRVKHRPNTVLPIDFFLIRIHKRIDVFYGSWICFCGWLSPQKSWSQLFHLHLFVGYTALSKNILRDFLGVRSRLDCHWEFIDVSYSLHTGYTATTGQTNRKFSRFMAM